MGDISEGVGKEIVQLLTALRQELVQGSVKLFREYFASDAIILAIDDSRIFKGKDSCLEYVRALEQDTNLLKLDAEVEELKIVGDVAVVLDRSTSLYEVRGKTYRDTGRTTWVLIRKEGRWRITHIHLESLAPNRVVDRRS